MPSSLPNPPVPAYMARMTRALTILGIESSCDETAAAVLRLEGGRVTLLADVIHTQLEEHAPYQGVVPEIAARAHAEIADKTVAAAMREAGISYPDLDGVAATSGPGLIGGVLVGMMTGKAIAQAAGKPFIAVNHLEGHALSPRLGGDCAFPYLLLLVSGGHCQFLDVRGLGRYKRLGSTIDDAVGEAFDNAANTVVLDGYTVFDLRVSMPLGKIAGERPVEIFARAENLFDEEYQTAAGYAQAPRGIFAGLRVGL